MADACFVPLHQKRPLPVGICGHMWRLVAVLIRFLHNILSGGELLPLLPPHSWFYIETPAPSKNNLVIPPYHAPVGLVDVISRRLCLKTKTTKTANQFMFVFL